MTSLKTSIKTITYLSDIGCLEIQGASLLAASGVAYKERLNIPVIAEQVAREQPENLRAYFMERLRHYRQLSLQLPKGSDPVYQNEDAPKK
ncbi:TPA: DNA polymerase III subunit theta [Escherichia coli]